MTNMKKLLIGGVLILISMSSIVYWSSSKLLTEKPTDSYALGTTWVNGDYKYTITERDTPFYTLGIQNNKPECLVQDPGLECSGAMFWGKDGVEWTQSSTESIDCVKIVEFGFPKNKWPQCYR